MRDGSVVPKQSSSSASANSLHQSAPRRYLSGWKDIANYLGKGVRTVQRYERELGLPVRRPAGKLFGSVAATKAELDAWMAALPIREAFQLSKPAPDTSLAATLIQKNLTKLQILSNQMQALRKELRLSVNLLRTTVVNVRGELTPHHWLESFPPPATKKPQPN